jgi:hypothetical protein
MPRKKVRLTHTQLHVQFIQHIAYFTDTEDTRALQAWQRRLDIETSLHYNKMAKGYLSSQKKLAAILGRYRIASW